MRTYVLGLFEKAKAMTSTMHYCKGITLGLEGASGMAAVRVSVLPRKLYVVRALCPARRGAQ